MQNAVLTRTNNSITAWHLLLSVLKVLLLQAAVWAHLHFAFD
jgi:hypothetical protein